MTSSTSPLVTISLLRGGISKPCIMVHIGNPSTGEAKADVVSRPDWGYIVSSRPAWLWSDTLSQTKRDKEREHTREEGSRRETKKGRGKERRGGQGADGGGSFSKHAVKPWYCLAFSHSLDSSVKETVHPRVVSNLIITD